MKTKKWQLIRKCVYLGLLPILCAGIAEASTMLDISSGNVTYTIASDTNTGSPDDGYTGAAIDITQLPAAPFTHVANGISNGYSTADWVGPNANQSDEGSGVSGVTVYTVDFNLTNFNPATATLVMSLVADDYVSVMLNTTPVFIPTTSEKMDGMWSSVTAVPTITSGFIPGINVLTFTVPNDNTDGTTSCCGPTGLMAAVDVFATSTVPEPGTLGMTGMCLLGLATLLRRGTPPSTPASTTDN